MLRSICRWGVVSCSLLLAATSFAQTQPADWKDAILTPPASATPRINGPKIFGVRRRSTFLFAIPTTGDRPMKFSADNLPSGLVLDPDTGRMIGVLNDRGEFNVMFHATNAAGTTQRAFKIVCGDTLALTPPMGWNSWYCYQAGVTDAQIRKDADAIVATGLINHGYSYVNLDDGWSIQPNSKDPALTGAERDEAGKINSNSKFPDMRTMTAFIHGNGLKAGIYSSPGPLTCAHFAGSFQHEAQDAARFAEWGFDFLKYDWCSYGESVKDKSPEELETPFRAMSAELMKQNRDLVFSLCQYGIGDVPTWGREVGGNCWRTAGDLGSQKNLYEALIKDGFALDASQKWSKPGGWNDPDCLQVGPLVRDNAVVPSPLTPDEQYTHMSLWCLLSAPLLIGGDVANLDPFSLALLTNDEVIDLDQDTLGQQAHRVSQTQSTEVWSKDLEDGSKAVGLFNTSAAPTSASIDWSAIGLHGAHRVRDLWRQKDVGSLDGKFETTVPAHGVMLVRIFPAG